MIATNVCCAHASFSLSKVLLIQERTIDPYLQVSLNIKLPNNGNNRGITTLSIFALRLRLKIANTADWNSMYELGYAELLHGGNNLDGVGSDVTANLRLGLSSHVIHKIENLRNGKDLYFFVDSSIDAFARVIRDDITTTEPIRLSVERENYSYKYNRSEWNDHLTKSDFDKIELLELPVVELPDISPTTDILSFLHAAEKAIREGRWDDVYGDCRNALNVLYRGVDEWGSKQRLSNEENESINSAKDKTATKRNIFFPRLADHPEKGKRLNNLRSSLYSYLSLEPHQGEYQDVHFNREEASFALKSTAGFCAIVLRCLEHHFIKGKTEDIGGSG